MPINNSEDFVDLMTSYQGRLYGFIFSLVGNPDAANDVLQETNLILWNKSSEFELGSNFKAWSYRIASFQVMAYRQRKMRDRLIFDDDMMQRVVAEYTDKDEAYEFKQKKIQSCMKELPERQYNLINKRYYKGQSVQEIAKEMKSTANSITQALYRARTNLSQCVKSLLGGEA